MGDARYDDIWIPQYLSITKDVECRTMFEICFVQCSVKRSQHTHNQGKLIERPSIAITKGRIFVRMRQYYQKVPESYVH